MRVVPDGVVPSWAPNRSNRFSRKTSQGQGRQGRQGSSLCRLGARSHFIQWLVISCIASALGLTSAILQFRADHWGPALTVICSALCLIWALSLTCCHRTREDLREVFFVCQVVVLNLMLMILPISLDDPVDRATYLTWHSAAFKLLPIACRRFSCSLVQLACSCAIDAAVHIWLGQLEEVDGAWSVAWLVFSCVMSGYTMLLCFFSSRRAGRAEAVEQGLLDVLEKLLTEVFDSWVFLDRDFVFSRMPHLPPQPMDPVLTLLTTSIKEGHSTDELREAFHTAENSESRAVRARTRARGEGGEKRMELVIIRSLRGLQSLQSLHSGLWESCVPYYVVGISIPGPDDHGQEGTPSSPRPRVASLSSAGDSAASVISAAARNPQEHRYVPELGDNHSSSVFDIPPPEDRLCVDRSFEELVEMGKREHWIVAAPHLRVEEKVLGSGTFGTVLEGRFYGTPVAVKMPKAEKREHLPLLNELRTLRHLRHPNIVLFLGAQVEPSTNNMALVFELITGPTLHDWIKMCPRPMRCDVPKLNILRDILLALRYMHHQDKPTVHGDLKGTNVFVEICEQPRAKLGDFGLSRFLYKTDSVMGGSLRWMAPEIAIGQNRSPSCAADIFSVGALISFTITDTKPMDGMARDAILRCMMKKELPRLAWPMENHEVVRSISGLGDQCYSIDPQQRPNVVDVFEGVQKCLTQCLLEEREDPRSASPSSAVLS